MGVSELILIYHSDPEQLLDCWQCGECLKSLLNGLQLTVSFVSRSGIEPPVVSICVLYLKQDNVFRRSSFYHPFESHILLFQSLILSFNFLPPGLWDECFVFGYRRV